MSKIYGTILAAVVWLAGFAISICIALNVNVGISCNCLACSPTLDECLSDLVDDDENYNWQNIDDAFRFDSTLYFYHS